MSVDRSLPNLNTPAITNWLLPIALLALMTSLAPASPLLTSPLLTSPLLTSPLPPCTLQEPTAETAPQATSEEPPEIKDTPRIINPATLVPAPLAQVATKDFTYASLNDLVKWLKEDHGLAVLADQTALDQSGIRLSAPVMDQLDNEPIYLVLDRLKSLQANWYYEDEIVYITSNQRVQTRRLLRTYNIGDLIDDGFAGHAILETLSRTVAPESWADLGGNGSISLLGDVLFIQQTPPLHRQLQGLLTALRAHGRQTLVDTPPSHLKIREQLLDTTTVNFSEEALEDVVTQLTESSGIDIRLDLDALRNANVRPRDLVSLNLEDRSYQAILEAITSNFQLSWLLRDGVLWITDPRTAESHFIPAVYDVRDLCRNTEEAEGLITAITQSNLPKWEVGGGPGKIHAPIPGTLVVYQTEARQMELLALLEAYRSALRESKPRNDQQNALDEVITAYYRLETPVALGLQKLLPTYLAPETWQTLEQPDATGTIHLTPSNTIENVEYSTLIIRQSRKTHQEIVEMVQRISTGDNLMVVGGFGGPGGSGLGGPGGSGMGGMGGGGLGGSFGGGFFSLPDSPTTPR